MNVTIFESKALIPKEFPEVKRVHTPTNKNQRPVCTGTDKSMPSSK